MLAVPGMFPNFARPVLYLSFLSEEGADSRVVADHLPQPPELAEGEYLVLPITDRLGQLQGLVAVGLGLGVPTGLQQHPPEIDERVGLPLPVADLPVQV